jgi:hypothetical protein
LIVNVNAFAMGILLSADIRVTESQLKHDVLQVYFALHDDFGSNPGTDVIAELGYYYGFPFHSALSVIPYSVLAFSQ